MKTIKHWVIPWWSSWSERVIIMMKPANILISHFETHPLDSHTFPARELEWPSKRSQRCCEKRYAEVPPERSKSTCQSSSQSHVFLVLLVVQCIFIYIFIYVFMYFCKYIYICIYIYVYIYVYVYIYIRWYFVIFPLIIHLLSFAPSCHCKKGTVFQRRKVLWVRTRCELHLAGGFQKWG